MNVGQFRRLVLGAAVVLGFSGVAEARSHATRHNEYAAAPVLHGPHGTGISFSTARHGRSQFSFTDLGFFSRQPIQRSYASNDGFGSGYSSSAYGSGRSRHSSYAYGSGHSGGGIQCVTFARADSGIELTGNASAWWSNAAGVYQRGARPEAGSVLNFRANGSMRMGHVAVVNQVVDSRTIEIDHANWGGPGAVRGGISRDISVVDVSPANDWSAVRVALGHSGEFGSIYPTYGFIYNRPDHGTMVAANDAHAPLSSLNPAPRDLRGLSSYAGYDEVAEAPESGYAPMRHYGRSRHFARHVSYSGPSHYGVVAHHHRLHGRY